MRPPPPLLVPSSTPTTFQCRASRQLVEGDYVLQIVAQDDGSYWAGCSDGTIRQLDGELRSRTTLRRDGLTSLCGAGAEPHARTNAFVATASDGSAVGYDARDTRRPAFSIQTKNGASCLCAAQNSDLSCLALGTEVQSYEATIDIWDLRGLKCIHTFTEAHSDDLTSLAFHPTQPHLLLSGSTDGLLNTYDVRIADEDDAVIATGNVGASVARAGWAGDAGIWSLTTIESLSLWDPQELTELHALDDVRDVALQPWRTDYVVDCFYDVHAQTLCMLGGTQGGDVAVIGIKDPRRWTLETILNGAQSGAHADIVRTAHFEAREGRIVTGGEDGRVSLWTT